MQGGKRGQLAASRERRGLLSVDAGLGDGEVGYVGRTEFEADHGEGDGAGLGENFGQEDSAKTLDFDEMAFGIDAGELGLDLFHERANGHLTVFMDGSYFAGFCVRCNRLRGSVVSLAFDEEVVAEDDVDIPAVNLEAFETGVVRGDVAFGVVGIVDGSEAADDTICGNPA